MDMFPQTTKQRKRLWICSHVRKISKDIQPILSSQVEELSLIAIEGLDNVSFINGMDSIKQLTLAQMDSLLELPDFYELSKLKKITLYNIPIDIDTVPSNIRSITTIENE